VIQGPDVTNDDSLKRLATEPAATRELAHTLLPAAYARLRAIAADQRRRMPIDTLNTTALVNEAFLRIDSSKSNMDREQYFLLFATVVRNTLVDYIRARRAQKRDAPMVHLDAIGPIAFEARDIDRLLTIDAALTAMREHHPRLVQVVELRYFAGFENLEIAQILGVTERTIGRDWLHARARLAEVLDVD